jgi:hypothetical protein
MNAIGARAARALAECPFCSARNGLVTAATFGFLTLLCSNCGTLWSDPDPRTFSGDRRAGSFPVAEERRQPEGAVRRTRSV